MFELLFVSIFTILPDYLYRRYGQGKRIGSEITLFSVWYELRWGLTACFMLTVALITVVFFFHPSTSAVSSYYRTVTILPQVPGRVAEVAVQTRQDVKAGDLLFRLDDASQRTAVETAERRIEEVDASLAVAQADLAAAEGALRQAEGALQQARDDLERQQGLLDRGSSVVTQRDIDSLANVITEREGGVDAAGAQVEAVRAQIDTLLPAQKASAVAALAQAQAELEKTVVRAGVDGQLEQFQLQVGDYVSALLRPAGILVPRSHDHGRFVAGFGQLGGQILKPGMLAEIACATQPFRVIPMVVTGVQPYIAAGQFRPSDQLLDAQQNMQPGTLTVFLEPLYEGQADPIPPGSACVANAYTSFHDVLAENPDMPFFRKLGLHAVDTVGILHAIILRAQVLLLPVRTLVFSGSH